MTKKNQGIALISVLAATAVGLILISAAIVVAILNARSVFGGQESQKAYQGAEALIEETVIRYLRTREITNPYPDWVENCLQIQGFDCKMELNLEPDGGTVDSWGRVRNKIRHLQAELVVNDDGSLSVSSRKEIF